MAAPWVRSAGVWGLVLVAGGCVGAAVALLTSPVVETVGVVTGRVGHVRDLLSAPLLYLGFVGLVPLTAAAGWCIPRHDGWWGLVAAAPYWVMLVAWLVWAGVEEGGVGALMGIPIMVMGALTILPWGAGIAGASVRRLGERRRGDRF